MAHALYMALDPKQQAKDRPYPPLATMYAAAALRRRGHSVALFDAMLAEAEDAFGEALAAATPRVVALYEDSFNYLSKMCLARMRSAALAMVRMAVDSGVPVLVSGSDATDEPQVYLAAGATAVLTGEADHTLPEAVASLLHRRSLDGVPGLALPGPDGPWSTNPRAPERHPDVFPWPARDLVDMEAYRRRWQQAHGLFSTNMVSTRGCPFHCNWCAKPIWGQRYAMRSPEDVAAEMADVRRRYAPDHIWFADDIFGLRPQWTVDFGRAVAERRCGIPFQIQTRVDLVTDAAAEGLARAGCAEAWLGVESGSQSVLDAMDKGIDVEEVPVAVERLRRFGIRVGFFVQLGYPGEGWSDIAATAALVSSIVPDDIGVSVSYPLPGTRFHAAVAAQIDGRRRWRNSDDLAMMFRGAYSTDMYRALHRYLHADVVARLALRRARATGQGLTQALAQVAESEATWRALAHSEAEHRRGDATMLPAAPRLRRPDLSGDAN